MIGGNRSGFQREGEEERLGNDWSEKAFFLSAGNSQRLGRERLGRTLKEGEGRRSERKGRGFEKGRGGAVRIDRSVVRKLFSNLYSALRGISNNLRFIRKVMLILIRKRFGNFYSAGALRELEGRGDRLVSGRVSVERQAGRGGEVESYVWRGEGREGLPCSFWPNLQVSEGTSERRKSWAFPVYAPVGSDGSSDFKRVPPLRGSAGEFMHGQRGGSWEALRDWRDWRDWQDWRDMREEKGKLINLFAAVLQSIRTRRAASHLARLF